ncbi:uncharacterized protein EI90DRAFT_3052640 [Cantharellus anzutake]|uniref:uncharacterized protein n=1 Tax=Cantharellus anzutake TaxID=1750568 RepID=UPI001905D132|nr:uncharacterized protein EI90DRAFT_3052640 [Cantharellus anzutake]KAF8333642.1 hypothetical protein EI90DRAFT_3052640 [Cantharellus anzutake]
MRKLRVRAGSAPVMPEIIHPVKLLIPHDVVENIVAFADTQTLKALSLVSQELRALCNRFLWREWSVDMREDAYDSQVVKWILLSDRATYVHRLSITLPRTVLFSSLPHDASMSKQNKFPPLEPYLKGLLSRATHLRCITINCCQDRALISPSHPAVQQDRFITLMMSGISQETHPHLSSLGLISINPHVCKEVLQRNLNLKRLELDVAFPIERQASQTPISLPDLSHLSLGYNGVCGMFGECPSLIQLCVFVSPELVLFQQAETI